MARDISSVDQDACPTGPLHRPHLGQVSRWGNDLQQGGTQVLERATCLLGTGSVCFVHNPAGHRVTNSTPGRAFLSCLLGLNVSAHPATGVRMRLTRHTTVQIVDFAVIDVVEAGPGRPPPTARRTQGNERDSVACKRPLLLRACHAVARIGEGPVMRQRAH